MTIFSALNGSLGVARPPPPPRTGPKPRSSGQSSTAFGQRLIGGIFEKQTIELFANARLAADQGERGDEDIAQGVIDKEEENNTDDEFMPTYHQHKYSREHKLAAIDYFTTTWRELKDGTQERLSV